MRAWLKTAWHDWLRSVVWIVIAITAFRSAVADWNDVPTGSMRPTILEGDRIVVNKLAYDLRVPYLGWRLARWSDPEPGDIVVLHSPADGKRLVKRVVGLPGDTVAIRQGALVVNGKRAVYSPIPPGMVSSFSLEGTLPILAAERFGLEQHAVMLTRRHPLLSSFPPVTVPEEHVFVMGDNRDQSLDSRHFGPVARRLVVGRATAVAGSVDPDRFFLPRWERFLKPLQ